MCLVEIPPSFKLYTMKTGYLYDEHFLEHQTGSGHPECPERLRVTHAYLQCQSWFRKLVTVKPQPADEKWILRVHEKNYVKRLQEVAQSGFAYLDTPDVGICKKSPIIARLAAGGALKLADCVMEGKINNGFALLRPPGHHAEKAHAMGFCLFNNIAILARYLQDHHGVDKILILDWDVHHGNATQHTFEEDPSVLYISLHQYPFYPGTGSAQETGIGRGRGYTLNCPMPRGSGNQDYESAFCEKILPRIETFKPDFVLLSAGFDAHARDPLADICLTTEFFGWMTDRMTEVAAKHAGGRLVSLLEGGYDLKALPACVALHIQRLMLA